VPEVLVNVNAAFELVWLGPTSLSCGPMQCWCAA